MSKSEVQRAPEADTPLADSTSINGERFGQVLESPRPPFAPRWVKVLAIIALVLFLLYVSLSFIGRGGGRMHMATPTRPAAITHWGQLL